jgi:phosphatidylethanolamine-binding protein (PEBP) family uncharacterized protein
MSVLGRLLRNRHCGDTHSAWNRPNLQAPDHLVVTSQHFDDGQSIPTVHVGKRVGGQNRSPHLSWGPLPSDTAEVLLVVEDLDVPMSHPAVHCLALVEPSRLELPQGALAAKDPAAGVRILRSTITRGYHGPEPIKGHGPHRYTFQVFALGERITGETIGRMRPRVLLSSVAVPLVARGRITGTYER